MAVPQDMRLFPQIALLIFSAALVFGRTQEMELNREAFDFARTLIVTGHFVADKKGAWGNHHPTRALENDFIRTQGLPQYGRWHLATDERRDMNSKGRYKFPFGDFQNVHRCGLLAVKARAHEYGYREIEDAATKLLQMVDSARPGAQKRVD